ncbi:MAG: DUF2062 domain-containing protein [Flavobacteriales bacterium]|nr:DUF2062 domain-containing protein [Flavobacteriales bacterium]
MGSTSLGDGIGVLIPTYNNSVTLEGVLRHVQQFAGSNVLVVNDGSTDGTQEILAGFSDINVVRIPVNKGKGNALRTGFSEARKLGWKYAITIDSDGQHDPADLPKMASMVRENPTAMVMGARDMGKSEIPGKSSFGNKFSNFWFKVETGITLPDTQTGYRAWPLEALGKFRTISNRFGYEIESIVKLAWRGTPFKVVPVSVRYDFPERVSHFKPFQDFSRVSITHTWMVTVALLWFWPKQLFFKGGLIRILREEFNRPEESSIRKSLSVGFGFFMGILPLWGFQLLIGIPAAVFMKLNRVLFVTAANISIPPMIPLILFASYLAGAPFMGTDVVSMEFSQQLTLGHVKEHLMQYLIGSVVLAIAAGVIGSLITFIFLRPFRDR